MDSVIIGSVGVFLLLLAFALNLIKKLNESSPVYLLMNFFGALLAAWYAYDGNLMPFVILELVWSFTALFKLIQILKKGSRIMEP
ncbi:hypothetical protein ACFLQG_00200 [Candidatus Zixiibacteriota bacterium]